MTDVTDIRHYTNYPLCGFCQNAWNIIYGRSRTRTSPSDWVSYCRYGGCDPDVWEFIDDATGWPTGWKISDSGIPKCYVDRSVKVVIPKYDDRVFHRRASDDQHAPWRKNCQRLLRVAQERTEKKRNISLSDIEWDEEKSVDATKLDNAALLDDDIW